ncbi:MAG TPA: GcrA family cell cycle regulator [Roseococcus sp.]|jgi:GcrA cell cycle regulator|nr:GcrA family cell cycle regulator [Roseococcus sp.]
MDWTSEAIERLRALWSEGHSTAEIGRRMGVSKNSVVGKAHRLQLPARPSPIRRDPAAPRPIAAGRRPTLPPLRVVAAAAPVAPVEAPVMATPAATPLPPRPEARRPEPRVAELPASLAAPKPAQVLRPFARASARSCCWPIGEPGTPGFRFCSAEALNGKPYCAEHAAVAYVRVKDRREDAA